MPVAPLGSNLPAILGGTAAALAVAAIANAVVAKRNERRHPPRGRFVAVDGVRLHYLERGEGPPIVLLHGNGVTAEDFAISGVLDTLARDHRVIAFDRPGYGYSERPRSRVWTAGAQATLLLHALRQIGVERPVVVGHSWGTLVALSMALRQPDAVAGLALLSGYYNPTVRKDVVLMSGPAIPVLGDLLRYTLSPLLGWLMAPALFKKVFAPSKVTRRFRQENPTGLSLRPQQLRASAGDSVLMIPGAAATVGHHADLRMPVAIVAGTGDRIAHFGRQSERLHRDIPHSTLHRVEDAGHMIHHIAPDRVVAAIREVVAAAKPLVPAKLPPVALAA